jgi:hypothetical protein
VTDPYLIIDRVEAGAVFRKAVIPPGAYLSEHPNGSVIIMKRHDPADPASLICAAIYPYEDRDYTTASLVKRAWPDARDINAIPDRVWPI